MWDAVTLLFISMKPRGRGISGLYSTYLWSCRWAGRGSAVMRRGSPTSISMLVSTLETIEAAIASESKLPVELGKLVGTGGTVEGVSCGTKEVTRAGVWRVGGWALWGMAVAVAAVESPT